MQQNNDRPTALNCVEDAVSIVLGVRHGSTVAQSGKVRNGSDSAVGCRPQNRHWGYRRKPDPPKGCSGWEKDATPIGTIRS